MNQSELKEKLIKISYLFSLCIEDYYGDLDELLDMSGVDEDLLNMFLSGELYKDIQ